MSWNIDAAETRGGGSTSTVVKRPNSEYAKIEKQVNDARNLFIRSLSYHNPLEKTDSSVFIKNATALMEMEQIASTQKYLHGLSESFDGIQLNATLPGKKIFIPTDGITISKDGKATLEYILPPNMAKNVSLVLEVFDKDDSIIYAQDVKPDSSKVIWNAAAAGVNLNDATLQFRVVEKYDEKHNDITKAKGVFDVVQYVYSEIGPDGNRVNMVKTTHYPPIILQKSANWAIGETSANISENSLHTIQKDHVIEYIKKLQQNTVEIL